MSKDDHYFLEADSIALYLLNMHARDNEKKKYADAMQKLNITLSLYEELLWNNMLKSKRQMAYIDAGLAIKEPGNNVRRKIFIMLAILEASPNYTSYFLSRKFSFFYLFKLAAIGIRAVWRALIGVFLLKSIQRKCS